jgi:hypothetical protein
MRNLEKKMLIAVNWRFSTGYSDMGHHCILEAPSTLSDEFRDFSSDTVFIKIFVEIIFVVCKCANGESLKTTISSTISSLDK